jgi:uncharacterized protein with GYD domain
MATFVMVTRIDPEAGRAPSSFETLERAAVDAIRAECPQVKWVSSHAILGRFDYVDMFEAPSVEEAMKVSALIRTHGHAYSEIWPATDWPRFKALMHGMHA